MAELENHGSRTPGNRDMSRLDILQQARRALTRVVITYYRDPWPETPASRFYAHGIAH